MRIGRVEIPGRAALAPMAGVTDAAFRHVCRARGAALTCTEMVSSRGLVYNDPKTKELLFCPPGDGPVAAQIFGSDPAVMAQAAAMAVELGRISWTSTWAVRWGRSSKAGTVRR